MLHQLFSTGMSRSRRPDGTLAYEVRCLEKRENVRCQASRIGRCSISIPYFGASAVRIGPIARLLH